jgi:hypothetical protein
MCVCACAYARFKMSLCVCVCVCVCLCVVYVLVFIPHCLPTLPLSDSCVLQFSSKCVLKADSADGQCQESQDTDCVVTFDYNADDLMIETKNSGSVTTVQCVGDGAGVGSSSASLVKTHSFTVIATDSAGNSRRKTYQWVYQPSAKPTILWGPGSW